MHNDHIWQLWVPLLTPSNLERSSLKWKILRGHSCFPGSVTYVASAHWLLITLLKKGAARVAHLLVISIYTTELGLELGLRSHKKRDYQSVYPPLTQPSISSGCPGLLFSGTMMDKRQCRPAGLSMASTHVSCNWGMRGEGAGSQVLEKGCSKVLVYQVIPAVHVISNANLVLFIHSRWMGEDSRFQKLALASLHSYVGRWFSKWVRMVLCHWKVKAYIIIYIWGTFAEKNKHIVSI